MNRRTKITLVLAGFLLATFGSAVATVALNNGKDAGQNVAFEKAGGPNVTLGESVEFTNQNPYATSDQITLDPWGHWTSSGDTEVRVDKVNGTWTNMSQLSVDGTTLTVDINDKQEIGVEGQTKSLKITDMAVDDNTVDFIYAGSSGQTNLTVNGLPANTQIAAEDDTQTQLVAVATTDGSGTATFENMPNSKHSVRLTTGSSSPSVSNPSPTGTLQDEPQQLSVDLSDSDFPYDNVDVTFEIDGNTVATKTKTSGGTVTADISSRTLLGGDKTIDVTATDGYGNADSLTYTLTVPHNISVFNESRPTQKLTGKDVTVRFFGDNETVVEKGSGNNGKLNMTGLPVGETFVVTADTTNFTQRRIFVDSIYEQQEVYLLHTSVDSSDLLYQLDDRTGKFTPGDTGAILKIQRPLEKDFDSDGKNETRYQTISGDRFDATESYPATLEDDVRYRLRIRNDVGDERVLGAYRVTGPASETLTVGQLSFSERTGDVPVVTDASLVELNNSRFVRVLYDDSENKTSQVNVTVFEQGNPGNELINQGFTGDYGELVVTKSVPNNAPDNITYNVSIEAVRGGETTTHDQLIGAVPDINVPVDEDALKWMGWIAVVSLMGLVVVFDDSLAALVGTVAAAALGVVGIISVPPVALGVAGTIAISYATVRRT